MTIALENERVFKELKNSLELYGAYNEVESKAIYATAKEVADSALWGYERLVPLLQKECENAKKRIEVAKEAHKTLGAKLLGEYKDGHIDYDTLTKQQTRIERKSTTRNFPRLDIVNIIWMRKMIVKVLKRILMGFE